MYLKFVYSEKATKFCKIFTLRLSYVVPVKSKVKISQNFVAFSEYINFKKRRIFVKVCGLLRIYELYINIWNKLSIDGYMTNTK